MGTPEFRRLVREILKFRKSGWTDLSKDLIRLLAENALKNGQISQEEYDKLMAMLANNSEPPPPGYDRSNKSQPD
ncbi:hypothetical protein [Pseudomonas syringae]|uniref:hypothetical protein n=1 Tax=Pseudomonas syringae TaxID=317 RepID=UPI000CD3346F|nr:hypothetical protein [Pseudomonas syringae]MCF5197128.1 hypothetical protein [Pseudomonas syringae]MCF5208395.1 hypothetical protein [Pseudomonas syringae]MCF5212636.1 hypothetical protein [Pseudomonas syringae]MCF5221317.1 hypothetical protein [Pseudomonas syringae]MCF5263596.1 hypothetical protein [Pseudomonas syringae]